MTDGETGMDNGIDPLQHKGTPRLVAGSMVTTDIVAARTFYENFLGMECVRYAPDHLLIRDSYAKSAMQSGGEDFFVIDVKQVDEINNPQRMLHHWGLDVSSPQDVDRVHAEAKARKDELGLTRLMPVSGMHGAHSFYFADRDSNWWEIEYRVDGLDNQGFFERGDIGSARREAWEAPTDRVAIIDPLINPVRESLVGNARLTHGTCEQHDLSRARQFLETVLGMRCVRHLEPAQMIAGQGGFGVFAIQLPKVRPQGRDNRWILLVDSEAEVLAAMSRAKAAQTDLGLQSVSGPLARHGSIALEIQDGDGNWWELSNRPSSYYEQIFAAGDRSEEP